MTLTELLALPDETLNKLAAERVMGWKYQGIGAAWIDTNGKDTVNAVDWNPTGSKAHAEMLYNPTEERRLVWQMWHQCCLLTKQFHNLPKDGPYPLEWWMMRLSPKHITVAAIAAFGGAGGLE